MAICLLVDLAGVATLLPANGQACPPGYAELLEALDVPPNPFVLSVADGGLVAGAVASVWLGAYALRAIRSVLKDRDNE